MIDESKRIPLDQFMSYPDARLVGGNPLSGTGSIRWSAMMEALEAGRAERKGLPVNPEPMGEQVAIKGREPSGGDNIAGYYLVTAEPVEGGAVGSSELHWYAPLPRRVVIVPPVVAGAAPEVVVVIDGLRVNRVGEQLNG